MPIDLQIYQLTANPTLADSDVFASDNSSHLTYKNSLLQLQNYLTSGLTTGEVLFVSSANKLTASAGLSWNDTTKKLTINSLGSITVGNVTISDDNIVSVDTLNITSSNGISFILNNSDINLVDSTHTRSAVFYFNNHAGTAATGLRAANPGSNTVYTLPAAFPGSTQALVSDNAGILSFSPLTGGTVTSVSGVTANGFSFSITNPTTTPAITLIAGNITPLSVAATGTMSGSNLSGTNTGDQTITLTGDVTGSGTGTFAATISALAVTNAKIANTTIDLTAKVTGLLPLGNLASLQVNKYFYVDGQRTDSYTADGSSFRPFKTIGASITQIITNADNATHPYNVIVMPGAYAETLTFNNANLYNITFTSASGGDSAIQNTTVNGITSTSNNTNLANLIFNGITTNGAVNLTGDINATNFGSTQILFSGCQFNNSSSTIVLNNVNNVNFYNCQIQGSGSVLTFTNVAFAYMSGPEGITSGVTLHLVNNNAGNQPSQFSGNYLLLSTTKMYGTLTIDAGSELDSLQSYFGSASTTTNNGTIHSWETNWGGTLNLNNGSTSRFRGDNFTNNPVLTGSPTVQYQGHFGYAPATSANWNTVPINLDGALDTLATSGIVKSQTANLVLASPNGSSGLPSFRALVLADLSISSGFLLGRSTAGTGATQQITVGSGLTLSGGTLTASGSGGTVTSITAGTNLTGGTITTTGTIALSATPSGLTSLGVGNLSMSGSSITCSSGAFSIVSSMSGFTIGLYTTGNAGVALLSADNSFSSPLYFFNAAGTAYSALKAGASPINTTWTLPLLDTAGVMVSNGSQALSLTATPSGLTSIGVGNFSISASTISGTGTIIFTNTTASASTIFDLNGGTLDVMDSSMTSPIPLRFFNAAQTHFTGLNAGNPTVNTNFTLPIVNVTNGILQSDSSSRWSLTLTPSGLTSMGVGDITMSGMTITGSASGLALISSPSGNTTLSLGASGTGAVVIYSPANTNAVPLLFYNALGTATAGFKAPTSPSNTVWKLPSSDASGGLVSDGSANFSIQAQTNGQLLIGSTGTSPVSSALTPGTGISISNAAGSITISCSGGGMAFVHQTTSSVTMASNTTYFIDNGASLVTLTLPVTFSAGDVFRVIGFSSGGWKIAQNASQQIQIGNVTSTSGTSGYASSTIQSDSIEIVALAANTRLATCVGPQGNITIN
jgi:hypothetical protein